MAVACAGVAAALREPLHATLAIAALAAAVAAAVRALAGPSLAAAVCAGAASLLATFGVVDLAGVEATRAALAGAAAMFAVAELARPLPVHASPLPALGAALVAGALDPSYIVLLAIAGMRFVLGPWSRPRWSIAVPIAGVLATALACFAGIAHGGVLTNLWDVWAARSGDGAVPAVLAEIADTLGPITTVLAIAGLAVCTTRGRFAAAAALFVAAGSVAVDLRAGAVGAATIAIGATGAGVGIARLTAMIRFPTGQAMVGATVAFMLLAAPVMLRW